MTLKKPDISELKEKGLEVLNLEELKTKSEDELEMVNPGFLFEPTYDFDSDCDDISGYIVIHEYLVADHDSHWKWRFSCRKGNHDGIVIDLDGEDYGTFEKYIEYLECSLS